MRNPALLTLNDHNTGPFPIMQTQGAPPVAVRVDEARVERPVERCDWCGKEKHAFDTKGRVGSNLGSSAVLGRNMLEGRELSTHPWYAGPFSLAAHHLICLEALDTDFWAQICPRLAYHPDRKQNGGFLPMKMALACQLLVAVHRGHHAEGFAYDLHLPYPRAVSAKLEAVAEQVRTGRFCTDPDALVDELDDISAQILEGVASGRWTLTRDGRDYMLGGLGCGGLTSIQQKPTLVTCPSGRRHDLVHALTREPLTRRPLRVGE